jgi:hypothetical protein
MTEDERLVEVIKRMRPYASFWEWPDKGIKEHGIIKDFIDALSRSGVLPYKYVEAHNPDPPDFKAIDSSGRSIGIELTELVSEAAICENIKAKGDQNKYVYKDWSPEDFVSAVQERLAIKGFKKYNGACDEIHVVIFTDEPTLTHTEYEQLLEAHTFKVSNQIRRAYVLFSYDPGPKTYPIVELKLD